VRALIALTITVLTVLSLWWTTWTARRLLRQSLGRPLRKEEETSLKSWMQVDTAMLGAAAAELERNPFERVLRPVLRLIEWFPFWRDDRDAPPDDRTRLR
jgi:hypothetical protein